MELTETQEEILLSAIDMVGHEGLGNFTMRKLAKKLKLTESSLYYHFESKEKLFESILNYYEALSDLIWSELEEAELGPMETIHHFIMDRYQLFSVQNKLSMAMSAAETFCYAPGTGQRMGLIINKHTELLISLLRKAQAEGTVDPSHDPVQLFRIIVGSTRYLISHWNYASRSYDLVAEGEKLFQTIMNMAAPKEA